MKRRFTGRDMATILVAFFGVVFAVNFFMASRASATFGGVVVENSYVASQNYNRWLGEARVQDRLGWSARARRTGDDRVRVTLTGTGAAAKVSAVARHPLGHAPDQVLSFTRAADGSFISGEQLAPGRWTLRMEVRDGSAEWRREDPLE